MNKMKKKGTKEIKVVEFPLMAEELENFIKKEEKKKKPTITLQVRAGFVACHYWANAPKEVAFLRTPHRHLFSVVCMLPVLGDDRELEFFTIQRDLIRYLRHKYELKTFGKSCEIFAKEIKKYLDAKYKRPCSVGVYEDGENGAIVN